MLLCWFQQFTEVLSPHRPPAPPTEYFQLNIGGYDSANLLRTNFELAELQGFIGCVRGLKIGKYLIDLAKLQQQNVAHGKYTNNDGWMRVLLLHYDSVWNHYLYVLPKRIWLKTRCFRKNFPSVWIKRI